MVPPTPGKALTDKQKEAIKKVFNREITAGTKVSKGTVQNRCCTTPVLAVLASLLKKVKQVVNHVNYIIDSSPKSSNRVTKANHLQSAGVVRRI